MKKMLRKIGRNYLITALLLLSAHLCCAENIKLSAVVDSQSVYLFDRLTYQLTVESSSRSLPEPTIVFPEGLKIQGVPRTSSQIQIINGSFSNSKIYTYVLSAIKEGAWTIPPASIVLKGKAVKSNPIPIKIVKYEAAKGDGSEASDENIPRQKMQDMFLWAKVSNLEPFVGEAIDVTFNVYTRLKITNYTLQQPPSFSGFWVEEVDLPKNPKVTRKVVNGVEYSVATIHEVRLYPTVSGELIIDPLNMIFAVENQQKDPFDQFFNSPLNSQFRSSFFRGTQQEVRASQALSLNVKPLPSKSVPPSFQGAVGDFMIEAEIDKDTVQAGEAAIIRITLSGTHNLKTITMPAFPPLDGFKVFEPKAEEVIDHPIKAGWKQRTYEYIIVPHQSGDFEIPGVEFSFFNPSEEKYKTITTKAFQLHVNSGVGSSGTFTVSKNNANIELLGKDIRYIKTSVTVKSYKPAYFTSLFWFFILLPIPVIPVILIYGSHHRKLMGDRAYARSYRAKSFSQKRFQTAKERIISNQLDLALDETARAFQGYLADRLNLLGGSLNLNSILHELRQRNIDIDTCRKISDYWNLLETARFAPGIPTSDEVNQFTERGIQIVDMLEELKLKKQKKTGECR